MYFVQKVEFLLQLNSSSFYIHKNASYVCPLLFILAFSKHSSSKLFTSWDVVLCYITWPLIFGCLCNKIVVLLVKVTSKFSAKTFCNLQLCDFCRLANYPTDHVTLSSLMYFRLLPNFAGVLWEKIRTRTSFTIILSNCISEESLITAVYDKNIILS